MRRKLLLLAICLGLTLAAVGHQAEARVCVEDDTRSFPDGTCCAPPFDLHLQHYVCRDGFWQPAGDSCVQGVCSWW